MKPTATFIYALLTPLGAALVAGTSPTLEPTVVSSVSHLVATNATAELQKREPDKAAASVLAAALQTFPHKTYTEPAPGRPTGALHVGKPTAAPALKPAAPPPPPPPPFILCRQNMDTLALLHAPHIKKDCSLCIKSEHCCRQGDSDYVNPKTGLHIVSCQSLQ